MQFQRVTSDAVDLEETRTVLPDSRLIVFQFDTGHTMSLYMPRMAESYSVSQLAQRVAPTADESELARITRQLRHWTLTGVLRPLGATHTGAGRHRRYAGDAVHVAALQIELSRLGLPVGALHLVSLGIMGILRPIKRGDGKGPMGEDEARLWQRAITGEGTIHLTFNVRVDAEGAKEVGLALYDVDELPAASRIAEGHVSAIVADLTQLFEPLRADPGVESKDAGR